MSGMTEIWPDWEMAELIGIGGWSRVYRAVCREHPEIQAAVKMIPAPDEEAEQILRGAQRMQQLSGKPGIVRIEDAAILPEEDGQSTVMIRMELLRPLRSYLSDKILSESEVLRMGIELCRGLEECHVQGIVHGDIKPDNILVREVPGQDAMFCLGDFGTAGKQEPPQEDEPDDNESSEEIRLECTPEYLAPEQLDGKQDARTDIYSLGLTLYRYLNGGRLPFLPMSVRLPSHKDRISALKMRLSGTVLPIAPGVSREIMMVIWKACEFQPDKRYQDAWTFRKALEEVLDKVTAAEQADAHRKEGTHAENHRWKNDILLAVVVVLVLVAGAAVWKNLQPGGDTTQGISDVADLPLQDVEIIDRNEKEETVRDGIVRLKDGWDRMEHDALPASLTELPFLLDAVHYAPDVQISLDEETQMLLIRIHRMPEEWGVLLVTPDFQCLFPRYERSLSCWTIAAYPGWEKGWVFLGQSARQTDLEYRIQCESGTLQAICVVIHRGDNRVWCRAQLIHAGSADARWAISLFTEDGRELKGTYAPDGSQMEE